MAGNSKPRKPYRKKHKLVDNISHAAKLAGKLTPAERSLLIDPVWKCYDDLRKGSASNATLVHLRDVFNIAQLLAVDFGLLPDHLEKFYDAQTAILAVCERRAAGGSFTCYATELAALKTGIEFHDIQLEFASAGELARATMTADRKIRGAMAGSPGKNYRNIELPSEVTA